MTTYLSVQILFHKRFSEVYTEKELTSYLPWIILYKTSTTTESSHSPSKSSNIASLPTHNLHLRIEFYRMQQLPVRRNELISLSFDSITGFAIFTRTEETEWNRNRVLSEHVLFTCASHRRFSAPDKWPHLRTKFYPARPFIHIDVHADKEGTSGCPRSLVERALCPFD